MSHARTLARTSENAVDCSFAPFHRRIRLDLFFESGRKADERRGVVELETAHRADQQGLREAAGARPVRLGVTRIAAPNRTFLYRSGAPEERQTPAPILP